ncbi:MAG: class I SAM-dependent methyltransferase [Xanthobacteraceae bacterium]|nr:class I SAM-dependent methyltransferase [Xanthobacteraceae bacterium]
MADETSSILADVAAYYGAKLAEHGPTPRGVDWNGEDGQVLRFEQLTKVIEPGDDFSVNDLGCGYGALYDYLDTRFDRFRYIGCDISEDMLRAARQRLGQRKNTRFCLTAEPEIADYGIASGIFNVRQGRSDAAWHSYLEQTLATLNRTSRKGFAFNGLTSYSDRDKMRPDLYYADPGSLFDLCKRQFSRHVALLHDYNLYEFTIIVRRAA